MVDIAQMFLLARIMLDNEKTLSDEAGEELDETLSKAAASKRIDELQHKTGRGMDGNQR